MNIYPENSRDHRDCALATTFLLGTINAYPKCRGELSPAMRKLKQILFEIRDSLKIKKYSAGEERDIHAAIDSAEAHGFCYFEDAEPAAQYKSWLLMWFVSENAFGDAYTLSQFWKQKKAAKWKEAKGIIDRITSIYYRKYPREESEAFKIWACWASPYHDESLTSMWD